MKNVLLITVLLFILSSCKTQKEVIYFQNATDVINSNPDLFKSPKIQVGDELQITVSSFNSETVAPFNLTIDAGNPTTAKIQSYIVNANGNIDFPVIGRVKVNGFTREELSTMLQKKITQYVTEPIVTVKTLNYRVTVLGEVKNPGVYSSSNERISILEAIGKANDLTLYGRRDSILLIRNEDNKLSRHFIDLRNASIIDSSYFYLKQNDVVYVQPNATKTKESKVSPFNSLWVSVASVTLAVLSLIIRL